VFGRESPAHAPPPEGIYPTRAIVGVMSTNEPSVPIVCDECETETRVPLDDLADALERHNAEKHGGESVAEVDPAIKDRLADLVAEDLGLFDEDAAERP
jgi:hypothetical protein